MSTAHKQTLTRKERIKGLKAVEQLFHNKASHSLVAFPLRLVYVEQERKEDDPEARILVSAPKRQLRHAISRNRAKRQMREAYRLNKQLLSVPEDKTLLLGFVWIDSKLHDSNIVADSMRSLLRRLGGRL